MITAFMSKEGQKQFGLSRLREWAAKLHVVKKQYEQKLDINRDRRRESQPSHSTEEKTSGEQSPSASDPRDIVGKGGFVFPGLISTSRSRGEAKVVDEE